MSKASNAWGHDQLARDLAAHLRSSSAAMAWEDMQLGPSGSCRPDVYAIPKSYSKFRPMAYECKISVADFRSDITSGKWQKYLEFASGVVFAVPVGLITRDDVPTGCGLIVRHENVWRLARGPTLSPLGNLPREAWLKMLIDGVERQLATQALKYRGEPHKWSADKALRKRYGQAIADLVFRALSAREEVEAAVKKDRQRRDEIHSGTERYAQLHREQIERELRTFSSEQAYLASELGLPADASIKDLTKRVRECQNRLSGDAEIQRLRGVLRQITGLLDDGLLPLPGSGVT